MSTGALGVLTGVGIALALLLTVVTSSVKRNASGGDVKTGAVVSLMICWLASVVVFLTGIIAVEARLGPSEVLGCVWAFGIVAMVVSLIIMAVVLFDD